MWKWTLFLGFTLLFACTSEKDGLIDQFNEMSDHLHTGHFDALLPALDSASVVYLNAITDSTNLHFENIVTIGKQYNTSLFSVFYLHQFGNYIKQTDQSSHFFKYLAHKGTPWFSLMDQFELDRDRSRIGTENHVAITKEENGNSYIFWLAFTQTPEGKYKFDLIDCIQQEERRLWKFYGSSLGEKKTGTALDAQLAQAWADLGDQRTDFSAFGDAAFDRRH